MEFALLYELANPKPWNDRSEYNIWWEALEQVERDTLAAEHRA